MTKHKTGTILKHKWNEEAEVKIIKLSKEEMEEYLKKFKRK